MPTRDTAWPNGTPCWIDLGVPDLEAAKEFYGAVFGWTFSGGGPEVGGYTGCLARGLAAAGLGPQMVPDDPPRWTTYFATDDADATAAAITEAGGTLLFPPMDVVTAGRMCLARDPQGNPFGIWQANEHTGVQIYNEPGGLVWNDASVDDQPAGEAFYTAVFGFRFDVIDGMGGYATFTTDERPLGGFGVARPGAPKGWNTCFSVASADDAVAAVEAGGGKVTMAAEDSPYGRVAAFQDPWGAHFAVMQVAVEPDGLMELDEAGRSAGPAATPAPPYTAVIFTSVRTAGNESAYAAMAAEMDALARLQPGFLGVETARGAPADAGLGLTVSYWVDDAAARTWKQVARHLVAQRHGRDAWYSAYRVRVATVHREYGHPAGISAG